jgi:hypothetical protein
MTTMYATPPCHGFVPSLQVVPYTNFSVESFANFSPKNCKKIAFLTQNKAKLYKLLIITLFLRKTPFFRWKLAKIAENCDHNIDPWLNDFREQSILPQRVIRSHRSISVCFSVPRDRKFGEIYRLIFSASTSLKLVDFTVKTTTLDDVR